MVAKQARYHGSPFGVTRGLTQGDPLSMILYGIALVPLAETIRDAVPTVVQPWYTNDTVMAGPCSEVAVAMCPVGALGRPGPIAAKQAKIIPATPGLVNATRPRRIPSWPTGFGGRAG